MSISKKTLFSNVVIILILLFITLLPTQNLVQQILASIAFFCILPLMYHKFILKQAAKDLNLRLPEKLFDYIFALFIYLIAIIAYLIFHHFFPLQQPLADLDSFLIFFTIHILLPGIIVFTFEFFFRGFLFSIWKSVIGLWFIPAQWILFILLLAITRSLSDTEMIPYIFIAPFAGIVAYKTRSMLITFLFSWVFVILSYSIGSL